MAVNPLNPTMPYSINASNETTDNSRQRQEKNGSGKELKLKATTPKAIPSQNEPEATPNHLTESSALELTGQIIDSSKVVELLSHRPKFKKSVRNCFLTREKKIENSQIPDIKKFNKSF